MLMWDLYEPRKCKWKWSPISGKHCCRAVTWNQIKAFTEIPQDEIMSLLSEWKYLSKLVLWGDSLLKQNTQTAVLNCAILMLSGRMFSQ